MPGDPGRGFVEMEAGDGACKVRVKLGPAVCRSIEVWATRAAIVEMGRMGVLRACSGKRGKS